MRRKLRQLKVWGFTFVLSLASLPGAQAGAPVDLVRATVDRAMQILKVSDLTSIDKKNERVDRLKRAFDGIFDYEEMAKRALGRHWRQRTGAERDEFVKLFRAFLENVYADKLNLYGGQKVRFGREVVDNEFAQVESTIVQPKGDEINVVYKLRQVNGQWKVSTMPSWRISALSTIIAHSSIELSPAPLTKSW